MALREAVLAFWWLICATNVSFSNAVPVSPNNPTYDVLIVGGGPAGLATAMSLGRVGRSALLFDSAEYRNAATQEMHDVIGFDGVAPAEFRALARHQIKRYPSVKLMNATVTSISGPEKNAELFGSFVAIASNGDQYSGRRVVLATGMKDVLPSTPGLKEIWGKGIYWCSRCDGWEHKDKPFGNLVKFSAGSVNSTLSLAKTINPDSVILSNGTFTTEAKASADKSLPDWAQRLQLYNITINDRIIKSFGRANGNISDYDDDILVSFEDGSSLVRNAIKASFPAKLASDLPAKMNLELAEADDHELKVLVDKNMETSRQGVHAVGDTNSDGSSNVPHALWSAKRAVVFLHGSLGKEYASDFVAGKSLGARKLFVGTTFDAREVGLQRGSKDGKAVAQDWMRWLETE